MKSQQKRYWFSAKTYGYGWGLPTCWQGWSILATYILLIVGSALIFVNNGIRLLWWLAGVFIQTAALILVCRWKGPPPRWRWGDDDPLDRSNGL